MGPGSLEGWGRQRAEQCSERRRIWEGADDGRGDGRLMVGRAGYGGEEEGLHGRWIGGRWKPWESGVELGERGRG